MDGRMLGLPFLDSGSVFVDYCYADSRILKGDDCCRWTSYAMLETRSVTGDGSRINIPT
jgi:hypothetical protein